MISDMAFLDWIPTLYIIRPPRLNILKIAAAINTTNDLANLCWSNHLRIVPTNYKNKLLKAEYRFISRKVFLANLKMSNHRFNFYNFRNFIFNIFI
jgi:hypothetical protein